MTKPLFDTADQDGAQAVGRIDADHINSPDRLRLFAEAWGDLTITRSVGHSAIDLTLSAEEFRALIAAYEAAQAQARRVAA